LNFRFIVQNYFYKKKSDATKVAILAYKIVWNEYE